MPAGEMHARVGRTISHRWDDLTWQLRGDLWSSRWSLPTALLAAHAPTEPIGFLTLDRAGGLRERGPVEAAALTDAAESVVAGRIRFFGYPEVQLPSRIDFAYDPHAGVRWPPRHGRRIDYRHIGRGDPKWIWELNRCQQLPLLIQAWLVTGRPSYAQTAVSQALQWAQQNPPGRGIAWANGYEAGLRAISLSLTFDALRGSGLLTDEERRRLLEILWQHGRWIERDPSTHSSANNHRVGELVGMVSLCTLAPELPEARRWLREALTKLADRASTLILDDGMGAEMAFAYHLHVVDLLLVATAVLDAAKAPVPEPILSSLERSGDAIWAQIGEAEPALTYGDSDDALAARLGSREVRDARAIAAGIAARLDHPRARLAAGLPEWYSWWMFGEHGLTRIAATTPASPPGSIYLQRGGLCVLRRDRARVTVDVGPLGFGSLAAHGHADALSLTVATPEGEVITDPGVGSYFRDAEAREAFRGTAFHAVVEVDGRSQSEPGGAFLWTSHARPTARRIDLDSRQVFAEHDGYQRLTDPVRHRRAVIWLEQDELLVCDLLNANHPHTYRQQWPLAPALDAQPISNPGAVYHAGAAIGGGPMTSACLSVAATAPGQLSLARGERDPMRGWWSDRLESFEPAWHCSWIVDAPGDAALAAVLSLGAAPIYEPIRVAIEGSVVLIARERDDQHSARRGHERGGERYHVDFDADTVERASP